MRSLFFLALVCVCVAFPMYDAPAQGEVGLGGQASSSTSSAAYYYISKTGEITMPLNLWGMVKNPGRYEVPISTDLVQLLSFAGGPLPDADLSYVKITRTERREDSFRKVEFILDLRYLDKLDSQALSLRPGDTIFILPVAFRIGDFLSYVTTVAVLISAIVNIMWVSKAL
jgi:hypothetical protein